MAEMPIDDRTPLSRRDRARADTVREIKQTARRVLVDAGRRRARPARGRPRDGHDRARRSTGTSASREDLVENVVADLYDELVAVLEAARDDARPATAPVQLLACSRAFRRWAITHHAEFGLLFGSAGEGVLPEDFRDDCERPAQLAAAPVRRRVRRPGGADLPRARLPDPGRRRDRAGAAGAAAGVVREAPGPAAAGRHAGLPVLLDPALRPGLHGGLRAPEVRPGRRRARCSRPSCTASARVLGVADAYAELERA